MVKMSKSISMLSAGVVLVALLGLGWIVVGGENFSDSSKNADRYFFSFEDGMEGWEKGGTDLDAPPIDWCIERVQDFSSEGDTSLKFYLANMNDAGKIWVERAFEVESNQLYEVTVSYDFASSTYGDFNLWRIITGVLRGSPQDAGDLVYQGDAGNGAESDVGYKWLDKSYEFTVMSNSDGKLYVVVGIWGNWETTWTYYLDNLNVEFVPVEQGDLVTEEESKEIAEEFLKKSPTYKFDGFDLEHKETLYPEIADSPFTWTFLFEFKSRYSGYGDRSGESLLTVVTPHEAHITVENGEVTRAVLDLKWDMIDQKMLESKPPKPK